VIKPFITFFTIIWSSFSTEIFIQDTFIHLKHVYRFFKLASVWWCNFIYISDDRSFQRLLPDWKPDDENI